MPYFLEINALPSLEPGAGIYAAAELEGLHFDGVIGSVIQSAARRYGIKDSPRRQGKPAAEDRAAAGGLHLQREADQAQRRRRRRTPRPSTTRPSTLQAIREAIASWGHEVIDLEANQELPTVLAVTPRRPGLQHRRGLQGPEPRERRCRRCSSCSTSPTPAATRPRSRIALDKALAKKIVRQHGIHTPNFQLMTTGKERLDTRVHRVPADREAGGGGLEQGRRSSKSVVQNEAELREVVREMVGKYQQPALVEEYIAGPRVHRGAARRAAAARCSRRWRSSSSTPTTTTPVYSFQHKLDWNDRIRYDVPARLEPSQTARSSERAARGAFMALGCRDVARIDFRMDAQGRGLLPRVQPAARA